MGKKKPSREAIEAADPLTRSRPRILMQDPLQACNVCGVPSGALRAWREHDERDLPIEGSEALVFIGGDHPRCIGDMERHPRLYSEEAGLHGTFPALCGPCEFRNGLACSHPRLRKNGGPGLRVVLDGIGLGGFVVCIRGRSGPVRPPLKNAVSCEGRAP